MSRLPDTKDTPPVPAPSTTAPPAEASLETSRARELYEAGRLPFSSAEAAMDARRRVFVWLKGLFRR
jgi:hypothetical protein